MNKKIVKTQPASDARIYKDIKTVLAEARQKVHSAVNSAMVDAYWHVGRLIVEEEQSGKERAQYGVYLLQMISRRLTEELGDGFSEQSLRNMRQFYLMFPICSTLRSELSWSHYKVLLRVEDEHARKFYSEEAVLAHWSIRAPERQINTHYYERILSSKHKAAVKHEAQEKTLPLQKNQQDFIKDPYVLEFLNLKADARYLEKDIEQAIISQLQKFLLELGRGFSFVARQQRISTETKEFYVDLVFYNYILKCFVLIDLKMGELTHQDIGQMDMYVRLYENKFKGEGDGPTIGIILCAEKDETVVKYSVLKDKKRLFASKYKLYLPTDKEFVEEIEREKVNFKHLKSADR
ncbi:MAG: PDDEXK nuclease domain-containing protein [Candidatus Omnitrophota bacterium]